MKNKQKKINQLKAIKMASIKWSKFGLVNEANYNRTE